jgi:mono/diheme cytochrome c family protein
MARFRSIGITGDVVTLRYSVGGTETRERWSASLHEGEPVVERHLSFGDRAKDLLLVAGARINGPSQELEPGVRSTGLAEAEEDPDYFVFRIPAGKAGTACVTYRDEKTPPARKADFGTPASAGPRWKGAVMTSTRLSEAKDAYVVDEIGLPVDNPWKRALRPSDVQFLPGGGAYVVTIDGDVWSVAGLSGENPKPVWRRFTSGLHEPMTLAVRDGELFAFDRNGIWRLQDTDGDGEADVHEMFCNAFAQTADLREFPSTLRVGPGGEFFIAKGGQEAETIGKHNGSVLRVSADGARFEVLGYGFRQPNLAVHPVTGLVTSSDQQGHYVPSTPIHVVEGRKFYGFLSDKLPKEQYPAPIEAPLTWMPHAVNASALSQVWLIGSKMGPLDGEMVQICFNQPDLLRVNFNRRGKRAQASVASVAKGFTFPPLNGSVNPADGQLYVAGFQIAGWGNILDSLAGIGRVRHTAAPLLAPKEVAPTDKGVLVRFEVPVDRAKASDPDNWSLATWHYRRAPSYGSAQYKEDGSTGNDWLTPSAAYVSEDGRSVFIAAPGIKPVEQLRVGWSIAAADGRAMEDNAYTTIHELTPFVPNREGFGDVRVDLTPRPAKAAAKETVSVEEGRRLSTVYGCVACHSVTDTAMTNVGPKWKGLYGSKRDYVTEARKKGSLTVDDAYLRESILRPEAKKHASFLKSEFAMPSFAGVMTDAQIESVILYIRSLR